MPAHGVQAVMVGESGVGVERRQALQPAARPCTTRGGPLDGGGEQGFLHRVLGG